MSDHGLSPDEFDAVIDACRWIGLERCTPDYFKSFLVERLKNDHPELAARIDGMDPARLHDVCVAVRTRQQQARWWSP